MEVITKYENIAFKYKRSGAGNPLKIKGARANCIDVEIEIKTVLSIKPFH